jgi:general stress protein YciG
MILPGVTDRLTTPGRQRERVMTDKSERGFAGMDPAKQKQIASKGGHAAHAKGTAHEFTPDEARAAGRKGGKAAHAKGTAHEFTPDEARAAGRRGGEVVSQDRAHMADIGRKGGEARHDKAA